MILSRESMQSEKSREPRLDPRSPSYSGWVVDEKETEKLIGQLRKRFFWKPVKKRFVSGRNWPRVSNLRAKSSKRRSERYLLNLPIRRSVSGRSVSSDRGARSTCQVEGRKPWVCRSCPEAAWLRGGRCHGATCLPGAQDQG